MAKVISNTPYDDAFKTMYVECDELVYPLLNEAFGESYTGKEKIVRRGNEHFETAGSGAENRLFSDSFLEVIGKETKVYHCECESSPDGSIIVRMFRYGLHMASYDAKITGNELEVSFPNACILYLRSNASTPDSFFIRINVPGGGSVRYEVSAVKVASYSIDEIFEKKLYMLIPFYIFNLEKNLKEYDEDEDKLNELKNTYTDILRRLEWDNLSGGIQSVSAGFVKALSNKVIQNIACNYSNVRKEMGDIMGGHVLELDVIKYRNEGRKEGLEQGIEQGIEQGKINVLATLVKDGDLTIEKASSKLNVSVKEFEKIMADFSNG